MAYMNQETKARIAAKLKDVVPKGWKYSLAVRNHSTIVLTITSAPVNLIAEAVRVRDERQAGMDPSDYRRNTAEITAIDVNPYHLHFHFDKSLPLFQRILTALNDGNHDRSDIMTDYFDVGWYVNVSIGKWDKPFVVTP